MAKYRRTQGQYREIGRQERKFHDEVIETESITEEYVDFLRRKFETPAPPPKPKARIIKRTRSNDPKK